MKKIFTLLLCTAIVLCATITSHATCDHNYIETHCDATCVTRGFSDFVCEYCGDCYTVYDRLYETPDSCHMVVEGDRNGDTLTVTVILNNNPGFWANRLTLYYNNEALEAVSGESGNVWGSSALITINSTSENNGPYIRFYCQHSELENNMLNGVVFRATFNIKDSADAWNIRLEAKGLDNINNSHNPVPLQIINTINLGYGDHAFEYESVITEPTYDNDGLELHRCYLCSETKTVSIPALVRPVIGDTNGDGTLDMKDSLNLKIRIADAAQDSVYDSQLDLYEDGKINAKDLLVLKKMIAGIAY